MLNTEYSEFMSYSFILVQYYSVTFLHAHCRDDLDVTTKHPN